MSQSGEIANQSNTSSCGFAPLRTTEEFFAVRYFRGRLLRLDESVDSQHSKAHRTDIDAPGQRAVAKARSVHSR